MRRFDRLIAQFAIQDVQPRQRGCGTLLFLQTDTPPALPNATLSPCFSAGGAHCCWCRARSSSSLVMHLLLFFYYTAPKARLSPRKTRRVKPGVRSYESALFHTTRRNFMMNYSDDPYYLLHSRHLDRVQRTPRPGGTSSPTHITHVKQIEPNRGSLCTPNTPYIE